MKHSKRFWSDLFYVPKYEKVSDKAFSRIMLSSVFGILLCGICLAGLTWAWFSSTVTSTANTITAAKFTVDISVIEEGATTPLSPTEENGGYKYVGLTADKKYTVTVTASGTVSTGYCTVKLGSATYHTIQLYPAGGEGKPQSVDFTVDAAQDLVLTITPQWGTFAKEQSERLIGDTPNGLSIIPATESGTAYALTATEQSSIPEASTARPTAAGSAVSEPPNTEVP